jgi:hypothetical protein
LIKAEIPTSAAGIGRPSRRSAAALPRAQRPAATTAIALATFWLAYDGGTFSTQSRAAAGAVAWWTLGLGVALGILPRARARRSVWLVTGALGAYAAVATASIAWGAAPEHAFDELNRVALYVGTFLVVALAARRSDASIWCNGVAFGIAAIASLALASRLLPNLVGSTSYQALVLIPQGTQRLSYPVGYWNGLAVLVALGVPLLLRAATAPAATALARGAAVLPLPIVACALFLTSSRTGLVACAIGIAGYFVLGGRPLQTVGAVAASIPGSVAAVEILIAHPVLVDGPFGSHAALREGRTVSLLVLVLALATAVVHGLLSVAGARLRPSARWERATLVAGVVVCVAAIAAAHPIRLVQHFKQPPSSFGVVNYVGTHLMSANGSGRWQLWETAVDEWRTKPLLGRGIGSYESWQTQHGTMGIYVHDAHSLYLQTLGELGAVGLLALVVAFVAGIVGATRSLRGRGGTAGATAAAFAGFIAYAVGAGVDWMWQLPVVSMIGLALLAIALAGDASGPDRPSDKALTPARSPRPRRAKHRLVVAAVVALALALVWSQALEAASTRELQRSQEAAAANSLDAAAARARTAAQLEPWAASPYLQLALVEEQRDQLPVARGWIRAALARDDSDWKTWAISARLAAEAGAIAKARGDLAHARLLNPSVSGWGSR